jgi:hypothetical protein
VVVHTVGVALTFAGQVNRLTTLPEEQLNGRSEPGTSTRRQLLALRACTIIRTAPPLAGMTRGIAVSESPDGAALAEGASSNAMIATEAKPALAPRSQRVMQKPMSWNIGSTSRRLSGTPKRRTPPARIDRRGATLRHAAQACVRCMRPLSTT